MRWTTPRHDPAALRGLSQTLGVSLPTAALLWQRGLSQPEAARYFLEPKLKRLDDPFRLTNLREAVDRIRQAMQGAETILIFGDYDVDGVTSTTLLVSILQRFGLKPYFVVPRRLEEGYGLSEEALQRALEECPQQPDLFIALDCGTSSKHEVKWLRERDIDVVIVDHHQSKEDLPEDCLLVNPHVHDDEKAPWCDLCTVGLVFKLVHGLLKALREEGDALAFEIDLREQLDLVALGTLADLVPLVGENRILARHGLNLLRGTRRMGLAALMEVGGMALGEEVTPFDVSFRLGPRINASGRLADARDPIELLLSHDYGHCRDTARTLDEFNRQRQEIERAIAAEAEAQLVDIGADNAGLVAFHPEWHKGVVGIVASRLVQRFHRPVLVLGSDGEKASGSGRSVRGVDLVQALLPCADLLERWGGHPMAVGLTLEPDQVPDLREAFHQSILDQTKGQLPEPELEIACELTPQDLNELLLDELERLGPFGQGNPEPIFAIRQVRLKDLRAFGKNHLSFSLERYAGNPVRGVCWNGADSPPPVGSTIDLAARFNWNRWQGRQSPRLTLVDWKQAG
ncbi:MAG: single-stranded-DNA-specific exonuclease [Puniceicoccaceae bacterium 5H]|nr:MAG: single-stranded-DNA-specific exonuclease [Puniceicoccaceae bacterium 5H]